MNNVVVELVGAALLVYIIIRQVTPKKPRRTRFYILPIVALILAYTHLPHPVPRDQVWEAIISVGISIPFGIMQAYFTTLYQSQDQWYIKGDWRYVMSWLALFGLHLVTTLTLTGASPHSTHVVEWIAALEVAVVWGLRSLVLHLRYPVLRQLLQSSRFRTN